MRGRAAVLLLAMTAGCATAPVELPKIPLPQISAPKFGWPSALWPFGREPAPQPIAVNPREVTFGRDATLTLPLTPSYPAALSATQTVVARHEERTVAFQAALELAPDAARVTLIAPSGPRILTIDWTTAGVREERTLLAPAQLRGVDVLADIFLCLWPADTVSTSLYGGLTLETDGNVRRVRAPDRVIVEITESAGEDGAIKHTLRNLDRGYTLNITTQRAG